jgi:hypothetical protein
VPPLPPEQPRASATLFEVEAPRIMENGFVRIAGQDFFGQAVHSPNGRFLLAWRDQSTFVQEDGTRSVKPGRFLMYEGPVLRAEGVLDRPHDGKVADNGRFILNDWGNSGELSGAFHAFEPDGTAILSRTFSANLNNNGLAPDGRIAVCQTCNAPNSPDSSILAVFDLETARDLYGWNPTSGWASSYAFPAGGEQIALSYTRGGTYLYALDGTFLEEARWTSDQLREGVTYVAKNLLAAHGAALPADIAADMVSGFEGRLADEGLEGRDRAQVLKLFGQCREAQGNATEALRLYQDALALDPKVGLKRRVEQMRRDNVGR